MVKKDRKKNKSAKLRIMASLAIIVVIGILFTIGILSLNKLHRKVKIEAGTKLDVSQFIKKPENQGAFKTDITNIDTSKLGEYEIDIQIGEKVYSSTLEIIDTIAPKADIAPQEIWSGDEIKADAFVDNIKDGSHVKVTFKEKPDFNKVGNHSIVVLLEDTGANHTEYTVPLIVKEDVEPPKIEGVKDQTVFIGDKVSYKKNIIVTDNRDKNVKLEVDSSTVNLKKTGSYDVTYSAKDTSGNTTTLTVKFAVKVKPTDYVSQEELDAKANKVLDLIIKDGMTQREKAKAIYNWTKNQIVYVDSSNKSDWVKAAYRGMTKRNGDCYVYYATARELLTLAGIENKSIVKTGGGHYWNLVNLGEGWYHFDATPRIGEGDNFFMVTDAQLKAYSAKNKNSHIWDKSKYPATP